MKYIVYIIILLFPLIEIGAGFILLRKEKWVKSLGMNWLISGIISIILTLILMMKFNRVDYLVGSLFIQVLIFLLLTMRFQIMFIIKNKA